MYEVSTAAPALEKTRDLDLLAVKEYLWFGQLLHRIPAVLESCPGHEAYILAVVAVAAACSCML